MTTLTDLRRYCEDLIRASNEWTYASEALERPSMNRVSATDCLALLDVVEAACEYVDLVDRGPSGSRAEDALEAAVDKLRGGT